MHRPLVWLRMRDPNTIKLKYTAGVLLLACEKYGLDLNSLSCPPQLQTCRILLWAGSLLGNDPLSFEQARKLVTDNTFPAYWGTITKALCEAAKVPYDPNATDYRKACGHE